MDPKELNEPVEPNSAEAEEVKEPTEETTTEAASEEAAAEETASEETRSGDETTDAGEAAEPAEEEEVEAVEVAEEEPAKTKNPKKTRKKAAKADNGSAESTSAVPEGASDAEASDDEPKLPMKWYVVHTYSGHENKVKENIIKMIHVSTVQDHFGRLIVPTEEVAEMKKGKKTITTRKFFPSYILIEMNMSDESWHLVNGIPGVTSFVGTGTKPQPLLPNEVERILGRMDKEKETIIPEIPYTLGEHIRIKDGPFSDFAGVVDEINAEKGKLRVLVSIFGRETPVELDFLQVESV